MGEQNPTFGPDASDLIGNGLPPLSPPEAETARFILRFRGVGPKPDHDMAKIRTWRNTTVLDDSSPRMVLVESSESDLKRLLKVMPTWAMTCEREVRLPEVRQRLRTTRPKSK